MTDTVIVRLRYAVTGSVSAAKHSLEQAYHPYRGRVERISGQDHEAKCFGMDLNPDEVSGYTNYETFHVALFLENNRDQHDNCSHLARVAVNSQEQDGTERVWLADAVQQMVEQDYLDIDIREEECITDSQHLAHSLLTAALGRVNWMEIADVFLTSARENQDAARDSNSRD